MAPLSKEGGRRPLPKFGEWDVNNPASAQGYTMIFEIARQEKKAGGAAEILITGRPEPRPKNVRKHCIKVLPFLQILRKWFCCGGMES